MTVKDIEKYVKVLRLSPDAKYILVVSDQSGLSLEDMQRLKLNDQFLSEMIRVHGNVNDAILIVPTK